MDSTETILRARIPAAGNWSMSNTSIIVRVEARTDARFATADEAYREAVELARALVSGTGYRLANRADLGVGIESLYGDNAGWTAAIDVCLAREEQLAGDTEYFPIDTP